MKGFTGFPAGPVRFTSVPDLFWAELLPQIDDLAELKVTLHCLWRLYRKEGALRYISRQELMEDHLLKEGLRTPGVPYQRVLDDAVARAITRGSLLKVEARIAGDIEEWLFVNTARARWMVEQLRSGELLPETMARPIEPVPMPHDRPTIFTLYEQNVGLLQPIIAEELREAAELYPNDWVEDAFRLAAERNIRNWKYIRAILERWMREGREDERFVERSAPRRTSDTKRRFRDELE